MDGKAVAAAIRAECKTRVAALKRQGVTLVLAAYRRPYHDIQDFTRFGLDPKSFKIVVVKSGYLSPELAPIANPSLMALSDGATFGAPGRGFARINFATSRTVLSEALERIAKALR